MLCLCVFDNDDWTNFLLWLLYGYLPGWVTQRCLIFKWCKVLFWKSSRSRFFDLSLCWHLSGLKPAVWHWKAQDQVYCAATAESWWRRHVRTMAGWRDGRSKEDTAVKAVECERIVRQKFLWQVDAASFYRSSVCTRKRRRVPVIPLSFACVDSKHLEAGTGR